MDTRLSKSALLVFALLSIIKTSEVAGSVNSSTESQCVSKDSCMNGGTQRCDCKSGFTGILCETDLPATYVTTTDTSAEDMSTMDKTTTGENIMDATTTDLSATYVTTTDRSTTDTTAEDMSTMDKTTTGGKIMDATTTGSIECVNTINRLEDYIGSQSRTFTNKTCQRWDSQTPHAHIYTVTFIYDGNIRNISQAENYCRNPDGKHGGPWCFTTNPQKRWEYCSIPICYGCKDTFHGAEYTGTHSFVGNLNRPCLRWEDVPNLPYTPANFSGGITNLSQAHNHCRNPGPDYYSYGPWCYVNITAVVQRVPCSPLFCQGCQVRGYYDGTKSTTKSGLACQRWDSQSPHPHNVTDPMTFKFSSASKLTHVNEAENYCRIVDGISRTKPWCFTTANNTEWEYCDVPSC